MKHEDIPGFMPAMTMPYKVKDPGAVQDVQPGDVITGEPDHREPGEGLLAGGHSHPRPERHRKTAKPAAARRVLKIGERVPDLRLENQDGRPFHFSDFKGKAVLVTFIYTRCPMPAFCPRLSSQFAKIHEALAKTPTITIEPTYSPLVSIRNTTPRRCFAGMASPISITMPRGSPLGFRLCRSG